MDKREYTPFCSTTKHLLVKTFVKPGLKWKLGFSWTSKIARKLLPNVSSKFYGHVWCKTTTYASSWFYGVFRFSQILWNNIFLKRVLDLYKILPYWYVWVGHGSELSNSKIAFLNSDLWKLYTTSITIFIFWDFLNLF